MLVKEWKYLRTTLVSILNNDTITIHIVIRNISAITLKKQKLFNYQLYYHHSKNSVI